MLDRRHTKFIMVLRFCIEYILIYSNAVEFLDRSQHSKSEYLLSPLPVALTSL